MLERALPMQQRKALEIAHLFVKMGIGFVPVPVGSREEFDRLAQESIDKLAELERAAFTKEKKQ